MDRERAWGVVVQALVVVAVGCGGASGATSRPGLPEAPADALARRVAEAAGLAAWGEVAELEFRFVVTANGERRADVAHRWDVRGERDRVRWTEEGRAYDVVVDLLTRTATATVDGRAATGDEARALGQQAYERWINDGYWLLLPLKLLDPGVQRTLEEPREHAGKRYAVLRLSFDRVGITPGDQYWLFIDEETARIERWEMLLEGASPPPRAMSFAEYRRVGPLTLALDHASDDGTRHVLLEDVVTRDAAEPSAYVLSPSTAAAPDPAVTPPAPAPAANAPLPYTMEQVRDATQVGRTWEYRREAGPRSQTVTMTVVARSEQNVEIESTTREGRRVVEGPERGTSTWDALREHALFPAAETLITEETVTVPAGTFACRVYTVARRPPEGGRIHRFFFANELPGAPVLFYEEVGGRRVMTQTLIRHAAGAP